MSALTKPIAVFVVVVASIAGCSPGNPTVAPNVTLQQQADASRSMGLSFPNATRFLLYHRETGGPDDAIELKIELPAPALASFLAQPPFSAAAWSSKMPANIPGPTTWPEWQPIKVQRFRAQDFQLPNGRGLQVLIDDDHDDIKVVYLFWFET